MVNFKKAERNQEDICVHCRTQEEAVALFTYLEAHDYKWNISNVPVHSSITNWEDFREETYYVIYTKARRIRYRGFLPRNGVEFSDLDFSAPVFFREIKPRMAVHCRTDEEVKALFMELDSLEYKWQSGAKLIDWDGTCFQYYGDRSVYLLDSSKAGKIVGVLNVGVWTDPLVSRYFADKPYTEFPDLVIEDGEEGSV